MAELLQQQSDTTEMMYLCFCESGNFDVELNNVQHHVGPWSMLIIQPKVQAKCVRQSPRFDFAAFGVTRDFFDNVMITFFRQEPQLVEQARLHAEPSGGGAERKTKGVGGVLSSVI